MSWEFRFGIEEEYFVNDAPNGISPRARSGNSSPPAGRTSPATSSPRCSSRRSRSRPRLPWISPTRARSSPPCARPSGPSRASIDLSIMASGTHPLAVWSRVRPTAQPRYGKVMHDLQMIGSRTVRVRHACPCGGAGSRHARRHHEPHPALSAAASGALHLLAVLAGAAHGPSRLSARRLPRVAAHRASRTCSRTRPITSATSIPSWLPGPSRIRAMSGG